MSRMKTFQSVALTGIVVASLLLPIASNAQSTQTETAAQLQVQIAQLKAAIIAMIQAQGGTVPASTSVTPSTGAVQPVQSSLPTSSTMSSNQICPTLTRTL